MKAFINQMMILMVVVAVAALVAAEAVAPPNMAPPPGADCDVLQLLPCLPAFTSTVNPPPECCKELKEQEPCYCKYMKDPNLQKYLNSPNGKNVAKVCTITIPKC